LVAFIIASYQLLDQCSRDLQALMHSLPPSSLEGCMRRVHRPIHRLERPFQDLLINDLERLV
jgi:hypothetical protein